MHNPQTNDERILILTPTGRDGPATSAFLRKAGFDAMACGLAQLVHELQAGVGAVLIAEEALLGQDVRALMAWIADQPAWSDLRFLMLTSDREASSIVAARELLMAGLQNATLVERPVQPLTLLSVVRSALRDRRHQYEMRAYMSERHDVEATLERLVAERTYALADSNEHLIAEMAERAQVEAALRQSQKLEAIGQLTGGVAHDFNNLLTVISSAVGLLGRPNLPDDKRQRYIDAIGDTVVRATTLTGQLLAFARRQPLKAEVFSAGAAVTRTAEMLRTIVGPRIDISLALADDTCFIHADKSQFETALVNMAVNARDAMDGEGHLTISVERTADIPAIRSHPGRSGSFVVVAITDTGTGIAPDRLARIFEPFYTTKEVGKGTGLGLSQVFGFAKQSGGEAMVDSTLGQGTTFLLYFRRVEEKVATATAPITESNEVGDYALASGRILVVEDNIEVGRIAVQLLTELGYSTALARQAQSAIDIIETDPGALDLVFSDVVMPGAMTGIDLAREIGRRWPDLPVILTTGYSDVLAEGGNENFDVLRKPYSVDRLSDIIRGRLQPERRVTAVVSACSLAV